MGAGGCAGERPGTQRVAASKAYSKRRLFHPRKSLPIRPPMDFPLSRPSRLTLAGEIDAHSFDALRLTRTAGSGTFRRSPLAQRQQRVQLSISPATRLFIPSNSCFHHCVNVYPMRTPPVPRTCPEHSTRQSTLISLVSSPQLQLHNRSSLLHRK